MPAVVFNVNEQALTADTLENIFSHFETKDDVFHLGFTEGSILVAQIQGAQEPTTSDRVCLRWAIMICIPPSANSIIK